MIAELMSWFEANQLLIEKIGNLSLVVLVVTIVALPIVVKKLPIDYFMSEKREPSWRTRKHPVLWLILGIGKNIVGLLLILAGIVMLVLPGQGTVTILIGLALTNFPGKYKLERRIASQPAVGKTVNKIRELTGEPPLQFPTG